MSSQQSLFPEKFEVLQTYLEPEPKPLLSAKTIQIVVLREIQDFTILRTEATGELNTAISPHSLEKHEPTLRVVFLGSKQKAPETRMMRAELEEYFAAHDILSMDKGKYKNMGICQFQKDLCAMCPRCILMGATKLGAGGASIKHRVIYKTAYSLLPYEELETPITFNAIIDATQKTGQALGVFNTVASSTLMPAIVTVQGATKYELALLLKILLKTKEYGARTATFGAVRNNIVGMVGGLEQIITPLELTLELYSKLDNISHETIQCILTKYAEYASTPKKVKVLSVCELETVLKTVRDWDFTDKAAKEYVKTMCEHALNFGKEVRK